MPFCLRSGYRYRESTGIYTKRLTLSIYDLAGDGHSKLDHMREMLSNVVYQKTLPFHAVLMDTWYATKDVMLFIEPKSCS